MFGKRVREDKEVRYIITDIRDGTFRLSVCGVDGRERMFANVFLSERDAVVWAADLVTGEKQVSVRKSFSEAEILQEAIKIAEAG